MPKTILMYPMTLASQAAHIVMRFQQNLAELAIKGDSTLESIFPPKDEKPEWATFDEDLNDAIVAFNANATGKKASEHGMSLEDMHVDDEPLQLASGFAVRVSRSKSGVTQFRNPAA